MRAAAIAMVLCVCAVPVRGDLAAARAEANLEKRSKLALDNAAAELKQARETYQKGDAEATQKHIAEAVASIELADKSLQDTGKDPRRSPKWFKRAELETRDLSRRVDSFHNEMSYTDRGWLDKLKAVVQRVHDELLTGLMEGKRK